ncbi:MAG: hypothetical protein H6869_09205 [Rhodospirillales bacterium]|nr:hypothetical protein [Rhodospirillales bacterium]
MPYKMILPVILLTVSGCAAPSTAPDFCSVYHIVPTLRCGSETQQLAVDQNNAVYLELCR